jgi:hypothetical protein
MNLTKKQTKRLEYWGGKVTGSMYAAHITFSMGRNLNTWGVRMYWHTQKFVPGNQYATILHTRFLKLAARREDAVELYPAAIKVTLDGAKAWMNESMTRGWGRKIEYQEFQVEEPGMAQVTKMMVVADSAAAPVAAGAAR